MTRDELLELSRLVSGEADRAEFEPRLNSDADLQRALARLERLSELTVEPNADDVAAANRAAAKALRASKWPWVLGGVLLLAAAGFVFIERVQPTIEHVQSVGTRDAGSVSAVRLPHTGRSVLAGVELELDGEFWWAEFSGAEPLTQASHVTRDNPSLENLPMKTFATPRHTLLVVWIVSGTVVAAPPVEKKPAVAVPQDAGVREVTAGEPITLPIEPGETVAFEPASLGKAWGLGPGNAMFRTTGEGSGDVVITHADGGVVRVPVNSTATATEGERRTTVWVGTPKSMFLHDVVRWDVGDTSVLTVARDGIAFVFTGLRIGETSFRAWDSQGRLGTWSVTVRDPEAAPLHLIVGMSKVLTLPDMRRVDIDSDCATTKLLGPRNLLIAAVHEGSAKITITLKDGTTKVRTVIVGPLPTSASTREMPMPKHGDRVDAKVGQRLSISVPGIKRVSQSGHTTPIDVKNQLLLIQPDSPGETTITIETHGSSASTKFTLEVR
ncbi:MAG: hypothetical protein ACO1OB_18950 [Archangium sp.]